MFSKLAVVASFLAVATATHTITAQPPPPTETTVSQCNSGGHGHAYCCNSAGNANVLPGVDLVKSALDIEIEPITALVGLACTSIVGGSCNNNAVCCTDNEANGLIAIGCINIVI